ncbi:MAG: hypothetical protein ISQ13_02415 [Candidatus Margulisbacteria bacterium]|nr:hypothetical protein [Candidatus Margulisiibacteriota bacterium]
MNEQYQRKYLISLTKDTLPENLNGPDKLRGFMWAIPLEEHATYLSKFGFDIVVQIERNTVEGNCAKQVFTLGDGTCFERALGFYNPIEQSSEKIRESWVQAMLTALSETPPDEKIKEWLSMELRSYIRHDPLPENLQSNTKFIELYNQIIQEYNDMDSKSYEGYGVDTNDLLRLEKELDLKEKSCKKLFEALNPTPFKPNQENENVPKIMSEIDSLKQQINEEKSNLTAQIVSKNPELLRSYFESSLDYKNYIDAAYSNAGVPQFLAHHHNCIIVVLTGTGDDGTATIDKVFNPNNLPIELANIRCVHIQGGQQIPHFSMVDVRDIEDQFIQSVNSKVVDPSDHNNPTIPFSAVKNPETPNDSVVARKLHQEFNPQLGPGGSAGPPHY